MVLWEDHEGVVSMSFLAFIGIKYADIDIHRQKIKINMEADKEFEAKKSFSTPLMWF